MTISAKSRFDILRVPVLGRFLMWKHSRTAIQLPLFFVAVLLVIDGLFGSPLAAKNTATVATWVHYRGFVVLALLIVGNLFCAACPFMLPRKLAKWIGQPTARWPKMLRNKWVAIAGYVGIIYAYELFDLWASPWLTAWLIVAYFTAAFVLEALFTRNSFCMYVCPLGTFNFLYSSTSPTQISARSTDVCRSCVGHDCINGSATQQGCQLELYVPTLKSNLDCTLCLDCAKACPHDNVVWTVRTPVAELFSRTWPRRLDLALLAVIACFVGFLNAYAMTPPIYALEIEMASLLNLQSEAGVLGLIYLAGAFIVPLTLIYAIAMVGRRLTGEDTTLARLVMRFAYAFVPMGFAIWVAHYLFHFLTGALTLLPAAQTFFNETLNMPLLGEPNWAAASWLVPSVSMIQALQSTIMVAGFVVSVVVAWAAAKEANANRRGQLAAVLPWILLLTMITFAALYVFQLPMEIRGSALGG